MITESHYDLKYFTFFTSLHSSPSWQEKNTALSYKDANASTTMLKASTS